MGYSEVCVAEPLAVYEDFVQNLRDSFPDLERPVFKVSFDSLPVLGINSGDKVDTHG